LATQNTDGDPDQIKLSAGDLQFLLATYASEESPLSEFVSCLSVWEYPKEDAVSSLLDFLRLDELGIAKLVGRETLDLDANSAAAEIRALYEQTDFVSPVAFLTDKGWKRYEVEDWGISTKRAKFLLFSDHANQTGNVQRVKGA
jgi:hypothetical protein